MAQMGQMGWGQGGGWNVPMPMATPFLNRPSHFSPSVFTPATRQNPMPKPIKVEDDDRNCPICKRTYSMSGVEAHIRDFHIGDAENVWKCGECHFKSGGFNEIGAHCLQLNHDSLRVARLDEQNSLLLSHLQQMQGKSRRQLAAAAAAEPQEAELAEPAPITIEGPVYEEEEAEEEGVPITLLPSADADAPQTDVEMSDAMGPPGPPPPAKPDSVKAKLKRLAKKKKDELLGGFDRKTGRSVCTLCRRVCQGLKRQDGSFGLNVTGLRYHAVNIHLDGHVFGCRECAYTGNKASVMRAHCQKAHNDESVFRRTQVNMGDTVWTRMEECFPVLKTHTKRPQLRNNVIKIYADTNADTDDE